MSNYWGEGIYILYSTNRLMTIFLAGFSSLMLFC